MLSFNRGTDWNCDWRKPLIMVPALLTPVSGSLTNRTGEHVVKALKRLRERLRTKRTRSAHCTKDCEHRADEQLHDMASRLHVLEWEAYGHRKKRTNE